MPRSPWTACATLALVAATLAPARAAPGDTPSVDGAVFAGVTGADPANINGNPAALVRLVPGIQGFVIATGAYDRVTIDRRTVDATTGALSPAGAISDATVGAGAMLGVTFEFKGTRITAISALRPPDETIDDPAVAYHTRGTRSRRVDYVAFAGGLRLTRWLYLGLSVAVGDRRDVVTFARDSALDAGTDPARGIGSDCGGAPCGLDDPAARELWHVDVTPDSLLDQWRYSVGLLARLPAGVWLGLSADRPWQIGRLAEAGDVTITRAPRDGGGVIRGEAVMYRRAPQTLRFGGRGPIRRGWELVGELRLRLLERTDPIDLRVFGAELAAADIPEITLRPTGMTDAVALETGLEQPDHGQRWRTGFRLGYDAGAVPEERLSARAPWGEQLSASLGVQLRLDAVKLQLGYRLDVMLPASTGAGAFSPLDRLACAAADYDYDLPACATVRAGYGTSTAAGDYGRQSHTLRVSLGFVIP